MAKPATDSTAQKDPADKTPVPAIKLAADSIMLMNRIVSKLSDDSAAGGGKLGLAEWSILRVLAANPGLRAAAVAKRLGISAQRVNQLVKAMGETKLIEAKRSETDTRVINLTCTAIGNNRLGAAEKDILALFEKAFADRPGRLQNLRMNLGLFNKALEGEKV